MTDLLRPDAAPPTATTDRSRRLLTAGAIAGPLFIAVAFVQVLLREGFDPARHPLSLLSLGDLGWIQIANFIVAGVLFVAAAAGMRGALAADRGARWGPRLMATFGAALVAGGVFVADPAFGFPIGAPAGQPDQLTWHGILHGFAPAIGFLALVVACLVLASRDAHHGRAGWALSGRFVGVAILVLSALPIISGAPEGGSFAPLWVAMVLSFGWASLLLARLRSEAG